MREGNGRAVITEHDLLTKNSVYYYLFLGRLSKSSVGTQAMMESDIFLRYIFLILFCILIDCFNYLFLVFWKC